MPVDRRVREEMASALAAYMRGEIDNFDLEGGTFGRGTRDEAARDIGLALWFVYDGVKAHPVSVKPKGWETLRRMVAFLKSDIPDVAADSGKGAAFWRRNQILRGVAALVTVLASVYLAVRFSGFWLMLPGVLVGIPFCAALQKGPGDEPVALPFYPFANESDWLTYADLLESERLPAYDPARHGAPIRGPAENAVLRLVGMPATLFIFVPLLSILCLLPRRRRHDASQ